MSNNEGFLLASHVVNEEQTVRIATSNHVLLIRMLGQTQNGRTFTLSLKKCY